MRVMRPGALGVSLMHGVRKGHVSRLAKEEWFGNFGAAAQG